MLAAYPLVPWLPGASLWIVLAIAGILIHLGAASTTSLLPRGPLWLLMAAVATTVLVYPAEDALFRLPAAWTAMITTLVAFAWLLPVLWRPPPTTGTGPGGDGGATPSLRTPR